MKMKIVVISTSFFETSIPLANYLSQNNDVQLFALFSSRFINPPCFDLRALNENYYNKILPISELDFNNAALNYIKGSKLQMFVSVFTSKIFADLKTTFKFLKKIHEIKPDIIHFIGSSYYYPLLYIYLKRYKLFLTFHEITYSRISAGTFSLKSIFHNLVLRFSIKLISWLHFKFIFHSENVEQEFKKKFPKSITRVIPFGRFEIFKYANLTSIKEVGVNYFLFFGFIREYKGADILIDAIKILNETKNSIRFVIAGKDANILKNEYLPSNVILIDKYLEDGEIAFLVENCKMVIAPHRKASQTGIINTAYAFNKPVIASNIPGIKELVEDNLTGLIFKSENSNDLAEKIKMIDNNKALYDKMVESLSKDKVLAFLNWSSIAKSTQDYYNS